MMRSRFGLSKDKKLTATAEPSETTTEPSGDDDSDDDDDAEGLLILSEGVKTYIDIVAIHGLNGHREKTWTAKNGKCWLKDFLPEEIPSARIMSWGYPAFTHGPDANTNFLFRHGIDLISDLLAERTRTCTVKRPIIFIAHDLGGIVLKDALSRYQSNEDPCTEEKRSIYLSTYGIIFMGTPHQGSGTTAWGALLQRIGGTVMKTDSNILKHLQSNSERLQQQQDQSNSISHKFDIRYAYERKPTKVPYLRTPVTVVPQDSAIVFGDGKASQIPINADHIGMVKFSKPENSGYKRVRDQLGIMANRAETLIQKRWEEDEQKRAAMKAENGKDKKFKLYFKPPMAITDCFVARNNKLEEIHRKLKGDSKLADGQRIIVIHGLGGMGKTQLAAKYFIYRSKEYSHVLWLNIKDETSVKESYMNIAERIKAGDPNMRELDTINPELAFKGVNHWLEREKNWLMVYDNYDNPKSDGNGSSDGVDIHEFLPAGNHGSIIITTTSSRVAIGERMELKKLDNTDSLEVLSHLAKKNAARNDSDVEKHAKQELANELDGHPLALTAAGTYIDELGISYTEYLCLYGESWRNLQDTTTLWPSYGKENARVYTTWQISFEQVKKKDERAAKLLELWAYLDNKDLWFGLLEQSLSQLSNPARHSGWLRHIIYDEDEWMPKWFWELVRDKVKFNSAISALQDYGLVSVDESLKGLDTQSTGYSIHSCVHAWTTHVLNQMPTIQNMVLAGMCLGVKYADDEAGWRTMRRVVGHASRWSKVLEKNWDTFNDTLMTYYTIRKASTNVYIVFKSLLMPEAATKLDGSLMQLTNVLSSTKPKITSTSLRMYAHEGDVGRLKALLREETREGTKVRAEAEYYLGQAYQKQGKWAEARDAFLWVMTTYEDMGDPGHRHVVKAAVQLAKTSRKLDMLDETERWTRWWLERCEGAHPVNREKVLAAKAYLAMTLLKRSKFVEVEETSRLALQQWEDSCGRVPLDNKPRALIAFCRFVHVYYDLGKYDEAKELYLKILPALEKWHKFRRFAKRRALIERRLQRLE